MEVQELLAIKWTIFFENEKVNTLEFVTDPKVRIQKIFDTTLFQNFFKFVVFAFEQTVLESKDSEETMQQFIREVVLAAMQIVKIEITDHVSEFFLDTICKCFLPHVKQVIKTKYTALNRKLHYNIFQLQIRNDVLRNVSTVGEIDENHEDYRKAISILDSFDTIPSISVFFDNTLKLKGHINAILISMKPANSVLGGDDTTPYYVQFMIQSNHPNLLLYSRLLTFFSNLELFNTKRQKMYFVKDELMLSVFLESNIQFFLQDPSLDSGVHLRFDKIIDEMITDLKRTNSLFPMQEIAKLFYFIFIHISCDKEEFEASSRLSIPVICNTSVKNYLKMLGIELQEDSFSVVSRENPHFWRLIAEKLSQQY